MTYQSRAKRNRGFQIHAFVFVATMALLMAINLTQGNPYWFWWPLFGWGIGVVGHWWFALGPGSDDTNRPS